MRIFDTAPEEKGNNKSCLDIKDILQSHRLIIHNVVYTDLESATRITVAPTPLKNTNSGLLVCPVLYLWFYETKIYSF